MPYLNSLAAQYAVANNYFANTHPSIGNYFMLTAGEIITNDDSFSDTLIQDNIVRHLMLAGKAWKEYSEDLPSVGYVGGDSGNYTQHHNPLSYFSDVRDSTEQRMNLVPFSQFAIDLANHMLPDFSFIVPNNEHNAHDCPGGIPNCMDDQKLTAADNWLKSEIAPLIASADFNTSGGGLLVITFDESVTSDNSQGGGHVAWVVAGPNIKKGFTSVACFQHQSTLRFVSEAIGLTDFPGNAASAANMQEFFSSP